MDRRRIELQLRMLRTLLEAERRRGDPDALAAFQERAYPIVERAALAIEGEADPELVQLLEIVRAEINRATRS